ncbi:MULTISPECIES: hypothetical protein [Streptomyces]|uniref:Uncharacterized protein n=1 Tax=Streptomyces fradiae ATCC 10745 = DSM 40063 TaxID=1319510 RepID=A0A1Y2NNK4_STRFR|nr:MULTISPECIES: hypothetical protein [Streptomyces]KAF0646301.1 hypothetical protein K701_29490 [Streptomyces fradiae ATCC 10745 = DSM 40063]OSY49085.1 hypothetical protein BG846_05324 [Streptomyces fradiae ATCC 10745 = DSM 40063]
MTDKPDVEHVDCADCCASPGGDNTRIVMMKKSGRITETWHTPDCPAAAILQIQVEESNRRAEEREAWARGVFPAAHERLKQAAAALPADGAAQPFVDALVELAQAQADATGFVVLHEWAEILERHFPPDLPNPDHTTE